MKNSNWKLAASKNVVEGVFTVTLMRLECQLHMVGLHCPMLFYKPFIFVARNAIFTNVSN